VKQHYLMDLFIASYLRDKTSLLGSKKYQNMYLLQIRNSLKFLYQLLILSDTLGFLIKSCLLISLQCSVEIQVLLRLLQF